MRLAYSLAIALIALGTYVDASEQRSAAVRAEFRRESPCPATGRRAGPCPGWEIDHRVPLCAGGRDETRNLQWLTVAAHRAKSREDVARCRSSHPTNGRSAP